MHETEPANTPRRRGPCPRGPKRASPQNLEAAALHYLRRFASSTDNFRRVMMRKVEHSARAHGIDREAGAAIVEALIARFADSGLLDESTYAVGRTLSLYRRGASPRATRAALLAKGVSNDIVEMALASLAGEAAEPELAAAVALARRRRLGPYGAADRRQARREKDLAALARAGFDYGVARTVIDAPSAAALEARAKRGQG